MTYEIHRDITGLYYIILGNELVRHGFESRQDAQQWLRDRGVRS